MQRAISAEPWKRAAAPARALAESSGLGIYGARCERPGGVVGKDSGHANVES